MGRRRTFEFSRSFQTLYVIVWYVTLQQSYRLKVSCKYLLCFDVFVRWLSANHNRDGFSSTNQIQTSLSLVFSFCLALFLKIFGAFQNHSGYILSFPDELAPDCQGPETNLKLVAVRSPQLSLITLSTFWYWVVPKGKNRVYKWPSKWENKTFIFLCNIEGTDPIAFALIQVWKVTTTNHGL